MIKITMKQSLLLLLCHLTAFAAENHLKEFKVGGELPSERVSPIQYRERCLPIERELIAYEGINVESEDRTFYVGEVLSTDYNESVVQIDGSTTAVKDTKSLHRIYTIGDAVHQEETKEFLEDSKLQAGEFVAYEGVSHSFFVGQIKKSVDEKSGIYEVYTGPSRGNVFSITDLRKLCDGKQSLK